MASTSNAPHFFKIVLHHTLSQGKLEVPDTFVKRNKRALLNTKVWLKLGNGAIWEVGLEKINGKIRFKYGWKEFMNFYSIKYGYLTVFRYEGSFCFHVLIFDTSGSEIKYPFQHNNMLCENEESDSVSLSDSDSDSDFDSDSDLQMLEDISSKKVVMQLTHVAPLGSKRKTREKGKGKVQKEFKSKDLEVEGSPGVSRNQTSSSNKRKGIKDKAMDFQSMLSNPSFVLEMKPSYIYPETRSMNVPRSFAHKHLMETVDILLRVSDVDRTWNVRYAAYQTTNGFNAEMRTGWKEFARDNSLKAGNVCVFEMIGGKNVTMKVTIFRSYK